MTSRALHCLALFILIVANCCATPAVRAQHNNLPASSNNAVAATTFHLPWIGGQIWQTTNGICGDVVSSHGCAAPENNYAWDFIPGPGATGDVAAVADGTVCYVQNSVPEDPSRFTKGHAGNVVVIVHEGGCTENSSGVYSTYAHLKPGSVKVLVGSHVVRGQPIGYYGRSGNVTGAHLHFSIDSKYWTYSEFGYKTASHTTMAARFADESVKVHNGVPRAGSSYRVDSVEIPNVPPNVPKLLAPEDQLFIPSRTITLRWEDMGDPDNKPRPTRDFFVEVFDSSGALITQSGWQNPSSWTITMPHDGRFSWHVKSGDGAVGGSWSHTWSFFAAAPGICSRKPDGDADCNSSVDLSDFDIFRTEFIQQQRGIRQSSRADFNGDQSVDIADFAIFRTTFVNATRRNAASHKTMANHLGAASLDNLGAPIDVFIDPLQYSIRPGQPIDVNVFLAGSAGLRVSGASITLSYAKELLEYVEKPGDYASPECKSSRPTYVFDNQIRVQNDLAAGKLTITKTAMDGDEQLPAGGLCIGSVVFQAKSDVPTPSSASVSIDEQSSIWELAGPDAPLSARFNSANSVMTADISVVERPTNVRADLATADQVTLAWQDNSSSEDGFKIYKWDGLTGSWTLAATVGSNVVTLDETGLACDTTYFYEVKSFRGESESGSVGWFDVRTGGCPGPSMPTGLTASTANSESIVLEWSDNSIDEDGFNVYRWDGGQAIWQRHATVGANVHTFTDNALDCGSTYFYEIKAYNSQGESHSAGWIAAETTACSSGEPNPPPTPPLPPNEPPSSRHVVYLPIARQ